MKKIILTALLCAAFAISAFAEIGTKRVEWYYKPLGSGERPLPPVEAHFMSDYDAKYIGEDEKCVYLTFDLGYENENVRSILNTLKNEDVKATFFLLRHTVANGECLEQIVADGHLSANHTLHHKDMSKITDFESFKAEIVGLEEEFKAKTGQELSKLYRPPCGAFNEQNLAWSKQLGYKTVFWSLAYADWDERCQMSEKAALDKIMSRMHNGAVILLHPTSSTNAKILPTFIKTLKEQGYEFKTADCL